MLKMQWLKKSEEKADSDAKKDKKSLADKKESSKKDAKVIEKNETVLKENKKNKNSDLNGKDVKTAEKKAKNHDKDIPKPDKVDSKKKKHDKEVVHPDKASKTLVENENKITSFFKKDKSGKKQKKQDKEEKMQRSSSLDSFIDEKLTKLKFKWAQRTKKLCGTSENDNAPIDRKMTLQRLTALRALMASQPTAMSAYIIPTADAHHSEYISPADARREWISGFTGSAGTALVTSTQALVWTDGRYYTQFEKEADMKIWSLMKESLPETPSMEKWLISNLVEGSVVGADPHTMTRDEWTPLQSALGKANMQLVAVPKNLVDEVRVELQDPAPKRPNNAVASLTLKYTGMSAGKKVEELRKQMAEKKASALVITALDEIAYTLNLRGTDIDYNPVFFSYLIITPKSVVLFWGDGDLPKEVVNQLNNESVPVELQPYNKIEEYLRGMAKVLSENGDSNASVWLTSDSSEAINRAAAGGDELKKPINLISEVSPVALMKLVKNEVELKGFRECHKRDGIAVIRFFRWLHEQIDNEIEVSEIQAADKLLEFRKDEADFMGPSFDTISGAGENGAIIHYSPSRDCEQRVIRAKDMFLLDSGGQYRDGTTDITRTRHMSSNPTAEQKSAFTRVLKGQIMVGSALFPKGVKGNVLDSFARKSLWDVGLDYAHGTGHGVGHYLNVHEGPSGISWRPYPNDPGLKPGQILSNEPGYYKVGEYGIRHEDLIEIIPITKNSKHPKASQLLGDYDGRGVVGFNTLTMVPNQRACMDFDLLDDFEISYINSYHQCVLETLGPMMKKRGLNDDLQWLENECRPIARG